MFIQPRNKVTITIDGLIGGGKTVLLKQLVDLWAEPGSGVIGVPVFEPVSRWEATGTFGAMCTSIGAIIKQREREAAASSESEEEERLGTVKPTETGIPALFQMFAALSRTADFARASKDATAIAITNPDKLVVVLCERSIWTDCDVMCENLKRGGLMSAEHALFYDSAFIEIENIMHSVAGKAQADMAIYLDTNVEVAMQRVDIRARADEKKTVDESYQKALDALHHEIFEQDVYRGAPVMRVDGSQAFHTDKDIVQSISDAIVARLAQHSTPSNSPALASSPGTDSPPVLSRAGSGTEYVVEPQIMQTSTSSSFKSEDARIASRSIAIAVSIAQICNLFALV